MHLVFRLFIIFLSVFYSPVLHAQDSDYFFRWKVPGVVASDSQMTIPDSRCTLPWGGRISDNQSIIAWEQEEVPWDGSCVSESRLCTAGSLSGSYQYRQCIREEQDTMPDDFSFAAIEDADTNTEVFSETVTVSGFDGSIPISVSGGGSPRISINGGSWVTSGFIKSDQTIRIRINTAGENEQYLAAITVGEYSTEWSVSTPYTQLVAWGSNAYSAVSGTPKSGRFVYISAGRFGSIAIREDGTLAASRSVMLDGLPQVSDFVQVTVGDNFYIARRTDGSLVAWGSDSFSRVSNTPIENGFKTVSSGQRHSVAIKSDGSLVSWGANNENQVSNTPQDSGYRDVSAGVDFSVAIKQDGSLILWGQRDYGLGSVPEGNDFVKVAAGRNFVVALKADGSLVSWGYNGSMVVSSTPVGEFIDMAAGYAHAVALKADGSLVSWGSTSDGLVSDTPKGTDFIQVAAGGGNFSVALRALATP